MKEKDSVRLKKMQRTLALYNMLANVLWSILFLAPIFIFCFTLMSQKTVYIFLACSSIAFFVSNSFLDSIQIGKTASIYKKAGMGIINRFAQNGSVINNLMKKKFPEYKAVAIQKKSISALINQSYMFEKFHWMLFLFFSCVIVFAIVKGHLFWAFILLVCNTAYNIYPNLLQQYIRLKLKLHQKRFH